MPVRRGGGNNLKEPAHHRDGPAGKADFLLLPSHTFERPRMVYREQEKRRNYPKLAKSTFTCRKGRWAEWKERTMELEESLSQLAH